MNRIAIITGTSKGIGQAIQNIFVSNRVRVISINRNAIEQDHLNHLMNFPFDLSQISDIAELATKISKYLYKQHFHELWIINNAATIGNIKKMDENEIETMEETIQVNLISPMALTSHLLKDLKPVINKIRVLNISSGAAFQPIHGLGAYCISKAGLEMFSKIIALEHADHPSFKSITLGPGVVDTNMQVNIRNSNKSDFERIDQFRDFKEKGLLASTDQIAGKILKMMDNDTYESGSFYDINSF
jgi:benzil reductase ((S)-benzoin forming)